MALSTDFEQLAVRRGLSASRAAGATWVRIALDDVGVVVDAELVRDGEQQGVGRGDRLVLGQLLDQLVGLGGVRPPEDRPGFPSM